MARHTPKRLPYSALASVIGLVLSMLISAPIALAQTVLEINITEVTLDRSGLVTVTGSVTCTDPAVITACAYVNKPVGRTNSVYGSGCVYSIQCEPAAPSTFSVTNIVPGNGRFVPGQVFIYGTAQGCVYACAFDDITVSKRLRY
jgi:hypothetical protein